jgi:hypothetical protein
MISDTLWSKINNHERSLFDRYFYKSDFEFKKGIVLQISNITCECLECKEYKNILQQLGIRLGIK